MFYAWVSSCLTCVVVCLMLLCSVLIVLRKLLSLLCVTAACILAPRHLVALLVSCLVCVCVVVTVFRVVPVSGRLTVGLKVDLKVVL